jgi:SAM-dependent methyltransferase
MMGLFRRPNTTDGTNDREDRLVTQCDDQALLTARNIETRIDDGKSLAALTERVAAQWKALSDEPFWSNANLPQYKRAAADPAIIRSYYEEGGKEVDGILDAFTSRTGVAIEGDLCVELGAGSGRHTFALSKRFKRVIAVDIAAPLLEVSRDNLARQGVTNVEFVPMREPKELAAFPNVSTFLAIAVLPHNAPPIQRLLLTTAFAQLRAGGTTVFQVQDWIANYTFATAGFLQEAGEANCDCHCLPKQAVFDVMAEQGIDLLDFAPDFFAECFGSYTFFGQKR